MLKYFCVYNGNLTTAISSIVNMDIQKYYNYNAIYNLASYELKKNFKASVKHEAIKYFKQLRVLEGV